MACKLFEIKPNQGKFLTDKDSTIKIEITCFVLYNALENWFEAYNKFTGSQVPVVFSPSIRKRGILGLKRRNWLVKNLKPANLIRLYATVRDSEIATNHPELMREVITAYTNKFSYE